MGLGSLWCTAQLRLGLDVDEDDVEEEEEEDELEVETGEEEGVIWTVEDVIEVAGGLTPTNPLTRLNRGSAHRLLLQLAGSRVKRPV